MNENRKKVVIIDYKNSNLFSVKNACSYVGLDATITSDKSVIENADAAILPGVGAFSDAMKTLENLDLIVPIKDFVKSGRPFMGICLGLQLLFSESEEFGLSRGLDLVNGRVLPFPFVNNRERKIKIPQIGWNRIYKSSPARERTDASPLKEIEDGAFMYFVHSFYVEPEDDRYVLTKTTYEGLEYCSSVFCENIFASQFHPEKSAEEGIKIYKAWAEKVKTFKGNG